MRGRLSASVVCVFGLTWHKSVWHEPCSTEWKIPGLDVLYPACWRFGDVMGCTVNTGVLDKLWGINYAWGCRVVCVCVVLCVRTRVHVSSIPSSCKEQWPVFVQPSFTKQLLHKRVSVRKHYLLPLPFKVAYIKYMTGFWWWQQGSQRLL